MTERKIKIDCGELHNAQGESIDCPMTQHRIACISSCAWFSIEVDKIFPFEQDEQGEDKYCEYGCCKDHRIGRLI